MLFWFFLVISLQLVFTQENKRETIIDKGTHLLVCQQAPLELGIVLDSSSSVWIVDFRKGIKFLQEFVQQYTIGPQAARVSIITFGRGIYPQDAFNLTTYTDVDSLVDAIGRVPHRSGLWTSTGEAIKYMHDVQLADSVVRPNVPKISIVITDGNSQETALTKSEAERARADGIEMFAVGIGSVRYEELRNIAGDNERVERVENYDGLAAIKEKLAYKTCKEQPKPTTTLPPKTICGEENPADINFVFSPADLGIDGVGWTTSFISKIVDGDDMDVGFRYGVVSGSCPDDAGFSLNTYNNVEDIKERLAAYNIRRMPALLQRLASNGFSTEQGGRPGARDVAVLIAPGEEKKMGSLKSEVARLVDQGVQVFIADPYGSGIQIDGANTLIGQSSGRQAEDLINRLCPQ